MYQQLSKLARRASLALLLDAAPGAAVIAQDVQPSSAQPSDAPPALLSELPAPPVAEVVEAPPPAAAGAPAGQWVFTEQYGWVFMPYAQAYTFVPTDG